MDKDIFFERVKEEFHYLVSDYGFTITEEIYDAQAFGNSFVGFVSTMNGMGIGIALDRGQVTVDIRPSPGSKKIFGLVTMVRFLAPDFSEEVYASPPKAFDTYHDRVDWQVKRIARILRQYCEPILKGEFTEWEEMDKMGNAYARRLYKSLTGKDLPL